MNQYLVPANTKKSTLILGFLRPIDAIIAATGLAVSIVALLLIGTDASVWMTLLACLPGIICALLVAPIPNYHNTLVGIQSILSFYNERRKFIWKGWCIYDEYKEKQ